MAARKRPKVAPMEQRSEALIAGIVEAVARLRADERDRERFRGAMATLGALVRAKALKKPVARAVQRWLDDQGAGLQVLRINHESIIPPVVPA
jgi:hypothetical protein